ncbi:MAG: N(4)-(beta-N-acetylglucosaminyl)-L-asparaginase [Bryobacterales bacterium]
MTRRSILHAPLAAAAAAGAAQAQGKPGNIVISSHNGMFCCKVAMDILQAGGDTLDAVIAGVNTVELDPEDPSVGYGGLPNEDGVVELDSCVMHGPTRRAGSVASLHGIKTPSKIAKLVMERSDHVMMVGEGALRFAKAHGYQEENLLTERARLAWLVWKESLGTDWGPGLDAPPGDKGAQLLEMVPGAKPGWLAWAQDLAIHPTTGTINCLALNTQGEMSGVTTTSGLAWKIPGRVGDSPLIGAGLYVDQDVGAGGSTGRGEEAIRVCGSHTIVENMRHGMSAEEAVLDTIKRVARNYDNDRKRLEQFDLFFYALRKDGDHAAGTLWSSERSQNGKRQFVVNDGSGSRLKDAVYLLER